MMEEVQENVNPPCVKRTCGKETETGPRADPRFGPRATFSGRLSGEFGPDRSHAHFLRFRDGGTRGRNSQLTWIRGGEKFRPPSGSSPEASALTFVIHGVCLRCDPSRVLATKNLI